MLALQSSERFSAILGDAKAVAVFGNGTAEIIHDLCTYRLHHQDHRWAVVEDYNRINVFFKAIDEVYLTGQMTALWVEAAGSH